MDWRNRTLSPTPDGSPKMDVRYACPGLCRFFGMVGCLAVSMAVFYGGIKVFGLPPFEVGNPQWTGGHIALVVAAVLFGLLAGVFGFGLGAMIPVRNERANSLFIILWQFVANGSLVWVLAVGIAMSLALGRDEAKQAVLDFGMVRALVHVLGTGVLIGLLFGVAFYVAPIVRVKFLFYLTYCLVISLVAAKWHFDVYGIDGKWWVASGLVAPVAMHFMALPMIGRDHQQRRVVMEEALRRGGTGRDV